MFIIFLFVQMGDYPYPKMMSQELELKKSPTLLFYYQLIWKLTDFPLTSEMVWHKTE
jgi:hypothetical protein